MAAYSDTNPKRPRGRASELALAGASGWYEGTSPTPRSMNHPSRPERRWLIARRRDLLQLNQISSQSSMPVPDLALQMNVLRTRCQDGSRVWQNRTSFPRSTRGSTKGIKGINLIDPRFAPNLPRKSRRGSRESRGSRKVEKVTAWLASRAAW